MGLVWDVMQSSEPVNPGPNRFCNAEDQVWIDKIGRLHITITKRDGLWTSSELLAKKNTGYGIYRFDIDGSVRNIDPNIVFGFFTWDQNAASYNREIDVEFSRWGIPAGPMGWFTVQPYDKTGNQHSFELPPAKLYSLEMRWEPGIVTFSVQADGVALNAWRYNSGVPSPGHARLHINFWLFRGKNPTEPGPYEAIISNMSFKPLR